MNLIKSSQDGMIRPAYPGDLPMFKHVTGGFVAVDQDKYNNDKIGMLIEAHGAAGPVEIRVVD